MGACVFFPDRRSAICGSGRQGWVRVYFSLTGDLPFVRSGRQGWVRVYFSLTGDLPFVGLVGRDRCVCIFPDRRSAICAVW